MESRLGTDLAHVRIHTGARAAAAARALGARAFTLGPDVFFGAGQYAPETTAGLRLLAHELVHVVQQGPERCGAGSYGVGLTSDPLEKEADRVAEEVLAGGALSPITRDAARVIRRTVVVNQSSAKIKISAQKVNPAIRLDPTPGAAALTAHLTNNFIQGNT
jgi:hypothetical protein